MRANTAFVIILIFLASGEKLFSQEGYVLDNLYFEGNETFSESELITQTSFFTVNWFERSILRKDKFIISEDYLEADLEKLVFFYQQNGFLQIRITSEYHELDHVNKSLDLKIIIEENKPVSVAAVKYHSTSDESLNNSKSDSLFKSLDPKIKLHESERFRDDYLEQDRQMIMNDFLNAGFAYVEIESELLLSDDEKEVEIIWQINSGPLCFFGQIEIIDVKDVSEDLIFDRIEFKSGDLYQKTLLDTTHHSIYSLGLFQVVSVQAILHQKKLPIIPVRISVKKASTYTTRFGAGYGSEDKFRAFTDILKLSFLGGARRLNLILSHSSLQPYNVDLRFIQPAFIVRPLVLILNPFMRKQDEPGYKVARKGVKSTFLYSFASRLTSSFTYTYEDVQRDTVDLGLIDVLEDRYKGLYDKSMFNLGFTWDTSYPMFYPVRGFLTSINFQYNGFILKSEYPFEKTILDIRTYQQISAMVLALRLKLGGIIPLRGNAFIPVEERFYSGGSYSVRGWARQELGPKDLFGNPLGGESVLEFSSEFRFNIYDPVTGVAFMDCGNVWLESYKWYLNEIRYSLGVGVRIKTPIGPVRLDVARPVFDKENAWQVHFSVGNAF
jgi:outer membrane protein insertion porin family